MSILRKLAGLADENKNDISATNKEEQSKVADEIGCQKQKHCDQCGSAISESDKFCGNCGTKIIINKKNVKTKAINGNNHFTKMPLLGNVFYMFLLLIFLVIGASVWTWDVSIFLSFIIFAISIAMISFFWGEIRNKKDDDSTEKQQNTIEQQNYVKNSKENIKNIIAFTVAFGLFILVLSIFFALADKKIEDNYYKSENELLDSIDLDDIDISNLDLDNF